VTVLASTLGSVSALAQEPPPQAAGPPPPATVAPPPDAEPLEVVVRAPARQTEPVETRIGSAQARVAAGTQGDPVKVLEVMPGIARPSFGSGALVVWGSAPADTRVYVDGVEIPQLFHGMALRSTIHPDFVRSVDLVPGGFDVAYGRALGGLVLVETASLGQKGLHGDVAADTLDASAFTSAALSAHARVGAAVRGSYLDRELALVSAPDVGAFFPIPRYSDYQAKAEIDLREGERLDVVFLGSNDALTRSLPSPDPASAESQHTSSSYYRLYARYRRRLPDGARVEVTPFVGYDTSDLTDSFGPSPTRLSNDSWRYGVRASHASRMGHAATLAMGVDALGSQSSLSRAGTIALPPREGDLYAFGEAPGDDVNEDDWGVQMLDVAPHVEADVELGALRVRPQLRFDTMYIEGTRQTPRLGSTPPIGYASLTGSFDPRIALVLQASSRLSFTASGGIYHQPPAPEDLSAVFGTPGLGLSQGTHATVGETLRITKTLALSVVGFWKELEELPFRNRLATPKLAQALVPDGEGRAWGAQMILRQELWRGFFGWASYTISRSERRYTGDPTFRLFDYDQPHVLALVGSQAAGRWTFGARFRYASGLPRTPVMAAYYDGRDDRYEPLFGAENSIRIPPFYALDLRIERSFPIGDATLHVYAETQNVTAHKNEEEIVYSSNYSQRGYVSGLPTLAVVGARVAF
jgi:hypothetical protein